MSSSEWLAVGKIEDPQHRHLELARIGSPPSVRYSPRLAELRLALRILVLIIERCFPGCEARTGKSPTSRQAPAG